MKTRIDKLLKILNQYSVEEINLLYKKQELEAESGAFTNHPDVKWSESLKKKILEEAKGIEIPDSAKQYLTDLIQRLNDYDESEHLETARADVRIMFAALKDSGVDQNAIRLIHIEFSDYDSTAGINLYGDFKERPFENELGLISSVFDSSEYWQELDSSEFDEIHELLEVVEIDEEEYPQFFVDIWQLRVFNIIQTALQEREILETLQNDFRNLKIEVGMHDHDFHTIFESA